MHQSGTPGLQGEGGWRSAEAGGAGGWTCGSLGGSFVVAVVVVW